MVEPQAHQAARQRAVVERRARHSRAAILPALVRSSGAGDPRRSPRSRAAARRRLRDSAAARARGLRLGHDQHADADLALAQGKDRHRGRAAPTGRSWSDRAVRVGGRGTRGQGMDPAFGSRSCRAPRHVAAAARPGGAPLAVRSAAVGSRSRAPAVRLRPHLRDLRARAQTRAGATSACRCSPAIGWSRASTSRPTVAPGASTCFRSTTRKASTPRRARRCAARSSVTPRRSGSSWSLEPDRAPSRRKRFPLRALRAQPCPRARSRNTSPRPSRSSSITPSADAAQRRDRRRHRPRDLRRVRRRRRVGARRRDSVGVVGDASTVLVAVDVLVDVGVADALGVLLAVGVLLGVLVAVAVLVAVGVFDGVGVFDAVGVVVGRRRVRSPSGVGRGQCAVGVFARRRAERRGRRRSAARRRRDAAAAAPRRPTASARTHSF